jgi:two-component sensor histidine kinase
MEVRRIVRSAAAPAPGRSPAIQRPGWRSIGRACQPSQRAGQTTGPLPTLPAMALTSTLLRASWQSWLTDEHGRRGPYWLQLVWTALFSMVVALGFTVLGFAVFERGGRSWLDPAAWAHWYGINLIVSALIAFLIHGLYELGTAVIGRQRLRGLKGLRRVAYYAGVPMLGVMIGWPAGVWLVGGRSGLKLGVGTAELAIGMLIASLAITFVFYLWFEAKARQVMAERSATEARFQLLQAQIEPHFLFNTLAHVESLIDHDPARAKRMLETFTDYLRASLGEMRRQQSTVGAELDMAAAYLRLLQLRMEDRLRFEIEADDAVRALKLPPLLLQPLVENAIQHGLEPKVEGGCVRLRATVEGEQLRLVVEDDGLGPDAPARRTSAPGRTGGLALANIRQRLASRHGDAASLTLEPLNPGTRATLLLPLEPLA